MTKGFRLMVGVVTFTAAAATADAQVFKTLYAFTGGVDGGAPWGSPTLYRGSLYGTTYNGGGPSSANVGIVYQYNPANGSESAYYTFLGQPNDGAYPMAGMVADRFGDFFGTTTQGGFNLRGAIYQISAGSEFLLYSFRGTDGEDPEGSLAMDGSGNLYGTTTRGGLYGSGTVFTLTVAGKYIQLHGFGNSRTDGVAPAGNVLFSKGLVYGTTTQGGEHGWGTVFSVDVHSKIQTVLYNFRGRANGGTPTGGLVSDGQGNLFGTSSVGGSANGTAGNGVIFEVNSTSHQFTVIHTFTGMDGSQPSGPLITDGQGNYFGTTYAGGTSGYGTVFEFNASGTLTTLYNFTNGTDGAYPYGGVTRDHTTGYLYGTATRGGQYNWGTLFEITP